MIYGSQLAEMRDYWMIPHDYDVDLGTDMDLEVVSREI